MRIILIQNKQRTQENELIKNLMLYIKLYKGSLTIQGGCGRTLSKNVA